MFGIVPIIFLLFSLTEIPHQPLCLTELYQGNNVLWKDLQLTHTYSRQDEIFLFPSNFYGESEIYSLGLFVDLDKNICNDLSANDYRILYQEITEAPSVLILSFLCVLLVGGRKSCQISENVRRIFPRNLRRKDL